MRALRSAALQIVPGQKIAYVTDAAYHADNVARIAALAAGADLLFIECTFLEADAADAARKCHLTAGQAGSIEAVDDSRDQRRLGADDREIDGVVASEGNETLDIV